LNAENIEEKRQPREMVIREITYNVTLNQKRTSDKTRSRSKKRGKGEVGRDPYKVRRAVSKKS